MAVDAMFNSKADEASCLTARQPAKKPYPAPSPKERRVDPEDDKAYLFSEFAEANRDFYEESEIIEYWFENMRMPRTPWSERTSRFTEATTVFADNANAQANDTQLRSAAKDSGRGAAVFVGGLPAGTTADAVEAALARCGPVAACRLLDVDGRPQLRRQARVDFRFPDSADKAIQQFHMKDGAFQGSRIAVRRWEEDAEGGHLPGPCVFVAKLDPATTAEEVFELFEGAGIVVVDVFLFRNKDFASSTPICKVELGDVESCKRASEQLHGAQLRGAGIIVRECGAQHPGGAPTARLAPQRGGDSGGAVFGGGRSRSSGPGLGERRGEAAIHVSGLGLSTTELNLHSHFAGVGDGPTACRIFRDDPSTSRGTAKVCFATQEEVDIALQDLQGSVLDGRSLRLRLFTRSSSRRPPGVQPVDSRTSSSSRQAPVGTRPADAAWNDWEASAPGANHSSSSLEFTAYVSRLSLSTSEESLLRHCQTCGNVRGVKIFYDKETGRPSSTAKVHFADEAGLAMALRRLHLSELDGSRISVRQSHSSAPVSQLHRGKHASPFDDPRGIYLENIVFVGSIDYNTTLESLKAFMRPCGEIVEGEFLANKVTGVPSGKARIVFQEPEGARRAVEELDGQPLNGRQVFVRPFLAHPPGGSHVISDDHAVFVANLSTGTANEALKKHFERCGKIAFANAGRGAGFAKVIFEDREGKLRALTEMSGTWLEGKAIEVQDFIPWKHRSWAGKAALEGTEETLHTVFVEGLSPNLTCNDVKQHFEACGTVLFANLLVDRGSGQPLGCGKVAFADAEGRARAIKELDGSQFSGRALSVREFVSTDEGNGISRWRGHIRDDNVVHVSGLSSETTIDQVMDHFKRCGKVVQANLHLDRETNLPKGTARVAFASREGMYRAMRDCGGSELNGWVISVREDDASKSSFKGGKGGGKDGKGGGKDGGWEVGRAGDKASGKGGVDARGYKGSGARSASPEGASVYVSGLRDATERAALAVFFEACGEVKDAVLFPPHNGKPWRSGKVTFTTSQAAERAVLQMNDAEMDGVRLKVRAFSRDPDKWMDTSVIVAGLHPSTDDASLREHFQCVGRTTHAFVMKDPLSLASKCMGKVGFASEQLQEIAIRELNGSVLDGNAILVRHFRSSKGRGKGNRWAPGHEPEDGEDEDVEEDDGDSSEACREEAREARKRRSDPGDGRAGTSPNLASERAGPSGDQEPREYRDMEGRAGPEGASGKRPGAARPAAGGTPIGEWLAAVSGCLLAYREAIEESFATLEEVLSAHASTGSGGTRQLDAAFFERAGIVRIAHKRLINKWIGEST